LAVVASRRLCSAKATHAVSLVRSRAAACDLSPCLGALLLPQMAAAAAAGPAHAPVRIGFVSTAQIASKNYRALCRAAPGAVFAGVASRDAARAGAWAAAREPPPPAGARVYESYDALLADASVDAVYMPLPTALHAEWVPRAIAAGKSVLLEKPLALSAEALEGWLAAARARGVVLWDGVMFAHSPRLAALTAALADPAFGRPSKVVSAFSFNGGPDFLATNIRVKADADPLGCVGDLGWYNIRFALAAFGYDLPATASALAGASTPEGVPLDAVVRLAWADGRSSHFDNSFTTAFRQHAAVASDRATLELDDFVIHGDDDKAAFTVTLEPALDARQEHFVCAARETTRTVGNQEVAMWAAFAAEVAAVRAGAPRGRAHPSAALRTQAVVDAVMASIRAGGATVAVRVPDESML